MTSYFDDANREVHQASEDYETDDVFLAMVEEIEERIIHDVNLVTGDREFPEDLREKMQCLIAMNRVKQLPNVPPTTARQYVKMMRESELIDRLHSAFHELARRRLYTRFGLMQDSPRQILVLRKEYDEERGGQ